MTCVECPPWFAWRVRARGRPRRVAIALGPDLRERDELDRETRRPAVGERPLRRRDDQVDRLRRALRAEDLSDAHDHRCPVVHRLSSPSGEHNLIERPAGTWSLGPSRDPLSPIDRLAIFD
jgi:hypothetical protein